MYKTPLFIGIIVSNLRKRSCVVHKLIYPPFMPLQRVLRWVETKNPKTSFSNCCLLGEAADQDVVSSLPAWSTALSPRSTGALINFISICKFAIITIISCQYQTIPNAFDSISNSIFDFDLESRLSRRSDSALVRLKMHSKNASR